MLSGESQTNIWTASELTLIIKHMDMVKYVHAACICRDYNL